MGYERTIIIGDVHGCKEELEELLNKLDYTAKKDRLIFVGDLINKGPDSLGVLEMVFSLKAEVVLGNHEFGFLRYLEDSSLVFDGFEKLKVQLEKTLNFWKSWFYQLPRFIEDDDFLVVHAGVIPEKLPAQTPTYILTNIRTWDGKGEELNNPENPSWFDLYHNQKLIVFGHWARKGLILRENAIGLDTGCVYGRKLTAVVLPQRMIYQVSAKKVYEPPIR